MVALGMEPRLWIVAAVVASVTAVWWLCSGLGVVVDPLAWYQHGSGTSATARPDRRMQLLTARLRHNTRHTAGRRRSPVAVDPDDPQPVDEIIGSLISVLDDHLRARHGIDRDADAQAASLALGPELDRFVSDPATARAMTQRRTLASTISLVEAFTAPPDRSTGTAPGQP